MKYYSAIKRNEFESVLMRWMNLEPIIQSEVSQKEKICNLENGTEQFIYRIAMEKQTQRIDLETWEEKGGEGEMERVTGKLTLPYVKWIANGNLLYDTGSSTLCSVTAQKGGMGWEVGERFKREGTYVYPQLMHFDV